MNKTIFFYEENCKSPIIDFIESLNSNEKSDVVRYFDLLEEYGLELGVPYIQKIGNKHDLWQLKVPFFKGDALFIFLNKFDNAFIMLHGFKCTNSTDFKEMLDQALIRLNTIGDEEGVKNDKMA